MTTDKKLDDPCFCNSKLKYRDCHGSGQTFEGWDEAVYELRKSQWLTNRFKMTFGYFSFQRSKLVGATREIKLFEQTVAIPREHHYWSFLDELTVRTFGREWFANEIRTHIKNSEHGLISIYRDLYDWLFSDSGRNLTQVTHGPHAHWLRLGYDLHVVMSKIKLPSSLIERLKNAEYPSARFELALAALFLRAGFSIEWADEHSAPVKPEFWAKPEGHNFRIAVEAKSLLHGAHFSRQLNKDEKNVSVARRLGDAFKKAEKLDALWIACLDLNLPPFADRTPLEIPAVHKIQKLIARRVAKGSCPINILMVINSPHHYKDYEPDNLNWDAVVHPLPNTKCRFELPSSPQICTRLREAISFSSNIPFSWEEVDNS